MNAAEPAMARVAAPRRPRLPIGAAGMAGAVALRPPSYILRRKGRDADRRPACRCRRLFFGRAVLSRNEEAMQKDFFSPSSQVTDSIRLYAREAALGGGEAPRPPRDWRNVFRPKLLLTLNRDYWRKGLVPDLTSGLIVGIVALPLAIAFAVASGVTPDKGLVTAIVAGFLISLLGGSRVQIGGPTGAFIVIVYGIIARDGLGVLMLSTMLAGLFLIGFGLLRLGSVIKFIPDPVIVGFTSGIAVTIFSTQIKDAFGLGLAHTPEHFLSKWHAYFAYLDTANLWAVGIAALTLAIILVGKRLFPKVPGSLAAILVSTALVGVFSLPVETIGSRFGDLPASFSLAWPEFGFSDLARCVQPAFTIALLCAIESLLSAVVADGMISDEHDSNTELIAQGAANLVTPLFGGIPATGAIARTVTNVKSGGRTPVAGLAHAATLLAITLLFGRYAKLIPMSCLAGILIVVAYNMSEWRSFISVLRSSMYEIVVLLATFFLTILIDLTVAIEIGMVLAAFLFIQRMARLGTVFSVSVPGGRERRDGAALPDPDGLPSGVDVFEISGPFFFAAARQYQQVLQSLGADSRAVIIRMRHVPFVDATGIRTFRQAIQFMQSSGRVVLLSGVRPAVLRDLRRYGIADLVGENHIFSVFDAAVACVRAIAAATEEDRAEGRSRSTVRRTARQSRPR